MVTLHDDRLTNRFHLSENRPVDELANLLTHGLGFVLSVSAAVWLMTRVVHHGTPFLLACAVYCISLTGLYAASTLSHAFFDPARRRFWRMLDQVFIFLLIAGSFTPFGVVVFSHGWWPLLFAAMWGFALLGVASVVWVGDLTATAKFTYGILGWLPVISLPTLVQSLPAEMLGWIIAGGLSYTVGTLFLIFDGRIRYLHAMWHAMVIAGSTCHYIAILMLLPMA